MLGASIVGIIQLGQACNSQAVLELSLHRGVLALKACICLVSRIVQPRSDEMPVAQARALSPLIRLRLEPSVLASSLFCLRLANSRICSLTKPSTFFSNVSGMTGLEPKAVDRSVSVSLVCNTWHMYAMIGEQYTALQKDNKLCRVQSGIHTHQSTISSRELHAPHALVMVG